MQSQDLAHTLLGHAGSLTDLGQREALYEPEAEHLEVALAGNADASTPNRRQGEPMFLELADDLIQLGCFEAAAPDQVCRGTGDELLYLSDASCIEAGESGRAEPKLGDVHGGTESAGAQVKLNVAHRRTAGKDVAV
jgi:hypothetical protein